MCRIILTKCKISSLRLKFYYILKLIHSTYIFSYVLRLYCIAFHWNSPFQERFIYGHGQVVIYSRKGFSTSQWKLVGVYHIPPAHPPREKLIPDFWMKYLALPCNNKSFDPRVIIYTFLYVGK